MSSHSPSVPPSEKTAAVLLDLQKKKDEKRRLFTSAAARIRKCYTRQYIRAKTIQLEEGIQSSSDLLPNRRWIRKSIALNLQRQITVSRKLFYARFFFFCDKHGLVSLRAFPPRPRMLICLLSLSPFIFLTVPG